MNLNEWVNIYITEISEDHSSDPSDKYVVRPCKNPKEPWAVWEGEVRVKGFATKEEAQAFADMKNKEQGLEERIMNLTEKNVPTDPSKWAYYKSQAKKKFDVYPSAYANGWAAKQYKAAGGGWRKSESVNEGIWPKSKLADRFEFILSDELKKNFKGLFYVDGYDLYHNDKKVMTINPDKDSANSIVKTLKSKIKESVNEGDVTKKINRRGEEDGLLVKHNGEEYHIVYSGDFDMGSAVQPYGIVMPGDDTVSFLGKDKKAKQIWKQLKPKVDKFFKTNEATADQVIKDLDKAKNDLLKKVNVLIAKKKKLYSNVDIESPMSADEKKLNNDIADLFSQINKLVLQKRSIKKESTNESKIKMNALDWGKSTAERNANLDKYDSLKSDKEREAFLRKLKGESVSEGDDGVVTEAKLSFSDLKKGQVLLNKFRSGRKYTILNVNPKFAEIKNLKTGNVMQIYSLNNYELKESVNEGAEPDIITQLRDVVENGYNTLKDPKTGKKMKVDTYSASAVTQVYDALKQQSNKDKFVSNGLVGMVNLAFKILNKQEIVEYDVETLEELNDFHQFMKEYKSDINEAEYQGREVKLGKIMQGDVKKFKVYVKNDKGNVVKVNFGQKGMNIKKDNPEARKSFRARMNCDNPGPRWKARYWSCRKW